MSWSIFDGEALVCRVWVFVRVVFWSHVLARVGATLVFRVFLRLDVGVWAWCCRCVGLDVGVFAQFLLKIVTLFLIN
jgi:hypothetical protein